LEEKEGDLVFVLTKVCAKFLAKLSSQNTKWVKKILIFFYYVDFLSQLGLNATCKLHPPPCTFVKRFLKKFPSPMNVIPVILK
jgi:hypothetical protein